MPPTIPPIDSSLSGYTPMSALSGISDPTMPLSTSLKPLGVGTVKTPSSAVPSAGGNLRTAFKEGGIGGETEPSKFASMLGNIGSGVSILGDLANIYFGFQQQKQAKKQFGAQMGFANANLENTVKSYNTRLADIYKARGFTQGDSADTTNQAITANSLNFQRIKG